MWAFLFTRRTKSPQFINFRQFVKSDNCRCNETRSSLERKLTDYIIQVIKYQSAVFK